MHVCSLTVLGTGAKATYPPLPISPFSYHNYYGYLPNLYLSLSSLCAVYTVEAVFISWLSLGELYTKKWRKYSALKSTKEFLTPT